MSRESKILTAGNWGAENIIRHYESFGWELLALNGAQITMTRETQNPVYADLVKYQAKYEEVVEKYGKVVNPSQPVAPKKFDLGTCFWLTLLAVVPGVIYIVCKVNQNKKYKEAMHEYHSNVAECNNKRAAIMAEIEQVLLESRATFFARH